MASAQARQSPHEIASTLLAQAQAACAHGQRVEAAALLRRAHSTFESLQMAWHAARTQQLVSAV
jgi:hypothetical protein